MSVSSDTFGDELQEVVKELETSSKQHEQKNQSKEYEIRARISEKEQDTRQEIARWFVLGFFALLFLILVCTPLYNFLVLSEFDEDSLTINLNDLLLTYSSILGPILGFVIGYYFKSKD